MSLKGNSRSGQLLSQQLCLVLCCVPSYVLVSRQCNASLTSTVCLCAPFSASIQMASFVQGFVECLYRAHLSHWRTDTNSRGWTLCQLIKTRFSATVLLLQLRPLHFEESLHFISQTVLGFNRRHDFFTNFLVDITEYNFGVSLLRHL